jgi:hypothetical protein
MSFADEKIEALSAMDAPDNMKTLQEIGAKAAEHQLRGDDFPSGFDLIG